MRTDIKFSFSSDSSIADDQIKGIPLLRIGLHVLQREELLTKIDDILEILKKSCLVIR